MIIVKFIGGRGNQMYQYAFYLFLKENYDDVKADITDFFGDKLHNGYEIEEIFDVEVEKANFYDILSVREEKKKDIYHKIKRKIIGKKSSHIVEQKFDMLIKTISKSTEGIFYDGQIFDAYQFVSYLIKSAKKSIVLINNSMLRK